MVQVHAGFDVHDVIGGGYPQMLATVHGPLKILQHRDGVLYLKVWA
jgi:hypothetical protein